MGSTRRLPVPVATAVGLVALAVVGLGACTGGGSDPGAATDSKSASLGGAALPVLPPGKYQTLPQPCIAVDLKTLQKLVPGATDYAGKEKLTYDTDRRVGCAWQGASSDGTTRDLSVDFERVVSYDPGISDDVQAEADIEHKAAAAAILLTPASPPDSSLTTPPSTPPTAPTGSQAPTDGGTSTGLKNDGDDDLAPRALTDVGDTAFINDVLKPPATPASSRTGARRDVTLVFRTSNVVVSITYAQTAPRGAVDPQSDTLQKGAREVADQLEHRIKS
ncbi:DUF3558 domain-containing protein [Streptomyces sp. NBC_01190]|uniref:DUF3558 domain-containing protein n=1 Tax=Streptomyces sp. NBC_01190 TaxID=2903767 RepID=UPI0038639FE1|nr:DUF3558 domain-containing protein [Streptomyces sp. NBC_01190]